MIKAPRTKDPTPDTPPNELSLFRCEYIQIVNRQSHGQPNSFACNILNRCKLHTDCYNCTSNCLAYIQFTESFTLFIKFTATPMMWHYNSMKLSTVSAWYNRLISVHTFTSMATSWSTKFYLPISRRLSASFTHSCMAVGSVSCNHRK